MVTKERPHDTENAGDWQPQSKSDAHRLAVWHPEDHVTETFFLSALARRCKYSERVIS